MLGCCCRPPVREPTPPEVRAAREREKELAELDRDIRTVFSYNLNLKAEEKDLFQFFSGAGKVLDVRIISDRNTRRSKGFAYIEYARRVSFHSCSGSTMSLHACFHTSLVIRCISCLRSCGNKAVGVEAQTAACSCAMQEDIVNAMALTGQVLMGQSVMVKSSEVMH